ncbi:MAG: hypothetical protein ACRDNG_08865, partial [Gaiellaceae bacterium]
PNERRFLRLAKRRLGHLFPYIPGQSGSNTRVRALAPKIAELVTVLARLSPSCCDRLRLLDSTPIPCAQSRETVKRSCPAPRFLRQPFVGFSLSASAPRESWLAGSGGRAAPALTGGLGEGGANG